MNQLIKPELAQVAGKVLQFALPIKENQSVVFLAGGHNLDLAYALAAECTRKGVETMVLTSSDEVSDARLRDAPLDSFSRLPQLLPTLAAQCDWLIHMSQRFDYQMLQDSAFRDRLLDVQRASAWSTDQLLQLCLRSQTHFVACLDPMLQQAQALGITFEETRQRFLQSLDIDYPALSALGERIIQRMRNASLVHLTCPEGTDLRLSPGKRPWVNDDGRLQNGEGITPYIRNLPVGEVFVAPLEDSAEGVLVPKTFPGSSLKGLRIEFRGTQPARLSAEQGFELLQPRLEKATGNPYCIAEFAIGTNPCADILLATEKALGTAHVAIGQNTWLGGNNACSVHMDFLVETPTIAVDGDILLKDGNLIVS